VQLDAARSQVETAFGLADRVFRQVEPDERDEAALGALAVLEGPVVRRAEARVPVGLVHAEHEAAGDPDAVEDPLELLVDAAEPVDVVPEVDVGVKDLGLLGQLGPELFLVASQQLQGTVERLVHSD
jgi:hypothetical protein